MATKWYGDQASSYSKTAAKGNEELDQQVRRSAQLNYMGRGPYDSPYPAGNQQQIENRTNLAAAAPDVAKTMASSLTAMAPAGYVGMVLAAMQEEDRPKGIRDETGRWMPSIMGEDPITPGEGVERSMERFTAMPKSESGKRVLSSLGNVMNEIGESMLPIREGYMAGADYLNIPPEVAALPWIGAGIAAEITPVGRGPKTVARTGKYVRLAEEAASRELSGDALRSTAELVAKYDDGVPTNIMRQQAGQTLIGSSQRGGPAYHGTPHKFDKFDLGKIGSGEGAQAYGHGLYFAESPGVAKSYQHQLTPNADVLVDGKKWGEFDVYQVANEVGIDTVEGNFRAGRGHSAMQRVGRHGGIDEAINEIDTLIPGLEKTFPKEVDNLLAEKEFLNKARDRIKVGPKQKGHLYEVDIPDETIGKMLDWDAPLSDEFIQQLRAKGINDVLPDNFPIETFATGQGRKSELTGRDLYERLQLGLRGPNDSMSQAVASQWLNEAGIPGIRFLDGSSRGKGEGTRNLVVFDPDSTIKQVKRDGEIVHNALNERDRGVWAGSRNKQRGSIQDTGGGKKVGKTLAGREGVANALNEGRLRGEFDGKLTAQSNRKDIAVRARKRFGLTDNFDEAGYIRSDGEMLDFSGKADHGDYVLQGDRYVLKPGAKFDDLRGKRTTDHRDISHVFDGGTDSTTDDMLAYQKRMRNVRVDFSGGIASANFKPTSKQMEVMSDGFFRKDVTIEFDHPRTGDTILSRDFNGPSKSELKRFFNEAQRKLDEMDSKGREYRMNSLNEGRK